MRPGGSRSRRAGYALASVLPALLLAGCIFDQKPLANIDRPEPKLGAVGDLDDEALQRIADRAEAGGMDATQVYRRLAERRPSSPEPRIALARHLQQRGDSAGAETEYRQALAAAPGDIGARLGLAQVLYSRGQLPEAGAAYRAVLERDSSNLRALNGLGAIFDNSGRHAEAQEQYRRALEVAPRDKTARNNLGLSLAMSGKTEEGIALLQALAAEPDATAAHKATLARAQGLGRGRRTRAATGG